MSRLARLDCFIDPGPPKLRQGETACCAAYLADEGAHPGFKRRWRYLLLKHDVPSLVPAAVREAGRQRHWDTKKQAAVLAEAAAVMERCALLGFVVGMDVGGWNGLSADARRVFGSPSGFCFLRLMRIVLDRIETARDAASLGIVFDLGSDIQRAGAIATSLLTLDSRTAEVVDAIRFARSHAQPELEAVALLRASAMLRLAQRTESPQPPLPPAKRRGRSSSGDLPELRAEGHFEMWDEAHTRLTGGSVWWDIPAERPRRGR